MNAHHRLVFAAIAALALVVPWAWERLTDRSAAGQPSDVLERSATSASDVAVAKAAGFSVVVPGLIVDAGGRGVPAKVEAWPSKNSDPASCIGADPKFHAIADSTGVFTLTLPEDTRYCIQARASGGRAVEVVDTAASVDSVVLTLR